LASPLPIAAALFSAAEAGHLRVSIVVSVILVGFGGLLPDRRRPRRY
jgi:hypothetical protein